MTQYELLDKLNALHKKKMGMTQYELLDKLNDESATRQGNFKYIWRNFTHENRLEESQVPEDRKFKQPVYAMFVAGGSGGVGKFFFKADMERFAQDCGLLDIWENAFEKIYSFRNLWKIKPEYGELFISIGLNRQSMKSLIAYRKRPSRQMVVRK